MLSSAAIPDLTSASSEPVTWVLLRGLSRAGTNWGEFPRVFVNQLAKLQPDVRVLLLDLPGHGELRNQSSPSSIAALVEACRADLRRRGVGAPVHLLAMSLGALIASEWAARYPQEVRGAVLINTSLRPFSPVLRRLRPLAPLQFLGFARSASAGEGVSSRVRLSNAWRQLLAALRFRASRARPEPPMLLLCSLGDGLVDWRCSQTLSRAWGVPLRMHTAAGHDLPQDDPPWVAAAVSEWVALRSQNETSAPR